MSAAFIEIQFSGDQVFHLFKGVELGARKPQRMLDAIGAYLDSDVTRRFLEGVTPAGTKWPVSQRAKEEGGKTLVDTTVLMSGVTHDVQGDDLLHGLTEIYSAIHHFGGMAGRGKKVKIPKREILGITGRQQPRIDKIVTNWMDGLWD
ncbi:phage virion morphogenesis protein [Bowmanella dokdonensis]|uniref:Phage virion morphogenesis protein n=1 Tax=Bowmanella dokdonensis TaxID=751969 RepID=A0A939IQT9_9ALTE|nr:phage virion morphogenesis protein [Bowmanella dokdonensis]MBN7824776.1 phage virion morphogenesis protein [Bowmanella dokdonensis]